MELILLTPAVHLTLISHCPLPGELRRSARRCSRTERLLCCHTQVSTAVLSITAKAKKKEKEKEKEKKEEEKMEVVGANIET